MEQFAQQFSMEIMDTIRLLLSCVCGFAVGYERQAHIRMQHRKSAGMRTHMLVCVVSAAMMLISKYGFMDVLVYGSNVRVDVSRIAAAIVSGVGFLGAGIIYVRRESIKGLTTAAGLWATSAVGMAIGCGMYFVGIILTILIVTIQELCKLSLYRDDKSMEVKNLLEIIIEVENQPGAVQSTINWIENQEIKIYSVSCIRTPQQTVRLVLCVHIDEASVKDVLLSLYNEYNGQITVRSIDFEEEIV